MKSLFQLSQTDYEDLIRETAIAMGVQNGIVEKDLWVCLVLDRIFRSDRFARHFVFKGGTSLSKVHKVIQRFSEDVDLIINWELFGYGSEGPQPWDDKRSNTQQSKLNGRINSDAFDFIREQFVPWLREELLDLGDKAPSVEPSPGNGVQIQYMPSFELSYVQSHVLLEIGPLAAWIPQQRAVIRPYVAEQFPDLLKHSDVPVTVTTAERTFWEKATILHEQAHNPKSSPQRYSRHYYDLYMMMRHGIGTRAMARIDLLEDVARFKRRFYHKQAARYDLARPGTLALIPPDEKIDTLRKDYNDMKAMFFSEPPAWERVLQELSAFEREVNDVKE